MTNAIDQTLDKITNRKPNHDTFIFLYHLPIALAGQTAKQGFFEKEMQKHAAIYLDDALDFIEENHAYLPIDRLKSLPAITALVYHYYIEDKQDKIEYLIKQAYPKYHRATMQHIEKAKREPRRTALRMFNLKAYIDDAMEEQPHFQAVYDEAVVITALHRLQDEIVAFDDNAYDLFEDIMVPHYRIHQLKDNPKWFQEAGVDAYYDTYDLKKKNHYKVRRLYMHLFLHRAKQRMNVTYLDAEDAGSDISKLIGSDGDHYYQLENITARILGVHNELYFADRTLSKFDVDTLFYYMDHYKIDTLPKDERDMHVVQLLQTLIHRQDIQDYTSHVYALYRDNHHQQDTIHELREKMKQQTKETREKIKNQQKETSDALTTLKRDVTSYKQELATTKTLLDKANEQLAKQAQRIKELEKQHTSSVGVETVETKVEPIPDVDPVDEPTLDEKQTYLENQTCAVIGGNINWLNKLKELFPHWEYVDPDNINIDYQFLERVDAVYLNTVYNNHGLSYKLKAEMDAENTPCYYIKPVTNMARTIHEFYDQQHKKGERS